MPYVYVFLADSIKRLGTSGQALCSAVATVSGVRERTGNVPGAPVARAVVGGLQYVSEKNSGFKTLDPAAAVLAGSRLLDAGRASSLRTFQSSNLHQ